MTHEHRLVVNLEDIAGIRWQCRRCGSAISYPLDQSIRLPQSCVACHEPLVESATHGDFQSMQGLVDALKAALRAHRSNKVGGTVTLELVDSERR